MRATLTAAAIIAALVATLGGQAGAATGKQQSKGNQLGVMVVKFAKGTSADQMRSAVTAAGGEIVTDLSKLNAITATSGSASFSATLKKNKAVTAVFADK